MNKTSDTTIKVTKETRDRLKKLGTCGDTLNSVIERLLHKTQVQKND